MLIRSMLVFIDKSFPAAMISALSPPFPPTSSASSQRSVARSSTSAETAASPRRLWLMSSESRPSGATMALSCSWDGGEGGGGGGEAEGGEEDGVGGL
jgi:hypothetical protein